MNSMQCKICNSHCRHIFNNIILKKYDVSYFKCEYCGFIQTEKPYWLEEAYNEAITDFDVGYVLRNLLYKDIVASIIRMMFNKKGVFLDYGGGYGLFVRLMRDVGFNFFRQDSYCQNIFAKYFDFENTAKNDFDLVTAFEVFEHLENPITEIEKIAGFSKSVLFSTTLQPMNTTLLNDWEYFAPEMGQHISFYTKKSLNIIAEKFNMNFYTNNKDFHLFTHSKLSINWIKCITFKQQFLDRVRGRNFCNKKSLIFKDVDYIKKKFVL